MNERVLCVDDDPNVLEAYQRHWRQRFHIEHSVLQMECQECSANDIFCSLTFRPDKEENEKPQG